MLKHVYINDKYLEGASDIKIVKGKNRFLEDTTITSKNRNYKGDLSNPDQVSFKLDFNPADPTHQLLREGDGNLQIILFNESKTEKYEFYGLVTGFSGDRVNIIANGCKIEKE